MSHFIDTLSRAEDMSGEFDAESHIYTPAQTIQIAEATLSAAISGGDDIVFEKTLITTLTSALMVVKAACPAKYRTLVEECAISCGLYVRALCTAGNVYMAASDRMASYAYSPEANAARLQLLNKYAEYYTTALNTVPYDASLKFAVSKFYLSLARTAERSGGIETALKYAQTALQYHPEDPAVHLALGEFYHLLEKPETALVYLKICVALTSSDCNKSLTMVREDGTQPLTHKDLEQSWMLSHIRIAMIYKEMRQYVSGIHYAKMGLARNRTQPDMLNVLGALYNDLARTDLARPCFETAFENAEDSYDISGPQKVMESITINTAYMHFTMGNNAEAVRENMKVGILWKNVSAFQNSLFCSISGFLELSDKMEIRHSHERINEFYKDLRVEHTPFYLSPKLENTRIRVGIVSADFGRHVVFSFIRCFLIEFDASKIELTCYMESPADDVVRPREADIRYRKIYGLSASDAAALIYDDGIDVLVDLGGHTAKNRLDVFALRPARVQVSYLGYPFSTGLAEMDFRITDAHCDSAEISQPFYSEKLVFVKDCFLCFDPDVLMDGARPAILPPPILSYYREQDPTGSDMQMLTVGCFGRTDKLSNATVSLYSDILLKNPRVRIAMKSRGFRVDSARQTFLLRMPESVHDRVLFLDYSASYIEHLAAYNEVDVSIDTFPYSGTTTCCDSLLMGTEMFTAKPAVWMN